MMYIYLITLNYSIVKKRFRTLYLSSYVCHHIIVSINNQLGCHLTHKLIHFHQTEIALQFRQFNHFCIYYWTNIHNYNFAQYSLTWFPYIPYLCRGYFIYLDFIYYIFQSYISLNILSQLQYIKSVTPKLIIFI